MSDVIIRLRDRGPLVVTGPVKIIDADGNEFQVQADKPGIALCRCGQSRRRPFCDGAHRECNFSAVDRAGNDPAGNRPADAGDEQVQRAVNE